MDNAEASKCVDDVSAQFERLSQRRTATFKDDFDPHVGDVLPPESVRISPFRLNLFVDFYIDHMQSIIKLPGSSDRYLFSHGVEDGTSTITYADRSQSHFAYRVRNARHPGGLSMFGHTIANAVEHGTVTVCDAPYNGPYDDVEGIARPPNTCYAAEHAWIEFWQYRPESAASSPLARAGTYRTTYLDGNGTRPSAVAYTRTADGSGLMFVLGRASKEGWLLQEIGGRWTLLKHFSTISERVTGGVWREFQSIHFVTECARSSPTPSSGALYLVATARPGAQLSDDNYADLFQLEAVSRGEYRLRKDRSWKPLADEQPTERNQHCNARYAANIVVRNGQLSFVCSGGLGSPLGVAEVHQ